MKAISVSTGCLEPLAVQEIRDSAERLPKTMEGNEDEWWGKGDS
jgi:hypothetical protein